jgi:hypothetical protein
MRLRKLTWQTSDALYHHLQAFVGPHLESMNFLVHHEDRSAHLSAALDILREAAPALRTLVLPATLIVPWLTPPRVPPAAFERLVCAQHHLRTLDMSFQPCPAAVLGHLAGLPSLKCLTLSWDASLENAEAMVSALSSHPDPFTALRQLNLYAWDADGPLDRRRGAPVLEAMRIDLVARVSFNGTAIKP